MKMLLNVLGVVLLVSTMGLEARKGHHSSKDAKRSCVKKKKKKKRCHTEKWQPCNPHDPACKA